MTITNVTRQNLIDVLGLAKDEVSLFLAIQLRKGFAVEAGNRKHMVEKDGAFIVMKGRPSVTYAFDSDALTAEIGTDKAAKLADKAAAEQAAYTARLAKAEQAAKDKRDATAKAGKVASLAAKLAALKGETGEVF
jgi:hypothetical protein